MRFTFGAPIALAAMLTISGCGSREPAEGAEPAPNAPRAPVTAEVASIEGTIVAAADRAAQSVVTIEVERRERMDLTGIPQLDLFRRFFDRDRDRGGSGDDPESFRLTRVGGSGVILRADGFIVTNDHVVQHADQIEVTLPDERKLDARLVGTDPATDLAVLAIEARDLPVATLADDVTLRPGQWVIAIGSPFGLDYTVTVGVVSAVGRAGIGMNEIEDYVQTDASINPGNSGGALVSLDGEVVGINTMIAGIGTGIGFAVPVRIVRAVCDQIIEHGRVVRAYIGVSFQELTPELAARLGADGRRGALVAAVEPGGPAAEAGIRPGDIIVSVDGEALDEGEDLERKILTRAIGASVALGVLRDGEETTVNVTAAERPTHGEETADAREMDERSTADTIGLTVEAVSGESARARGYDGREGLFVERVEPASPADRAGVRPRDLLVEADRRPLSTPGDLASAVSDGSALVRVVRGDEGAFYTVVEKR